MSIRRKERPVTAIDLALGARVRRLRHARGLTLVQLAEGAELSHPFLSQLERGLARPSISSLEKIARALGSSQLELLADVDDEQTARRPVEPVTLVRSGDGQTGTYGGGMARMLVSGRRRFSPMEFTGANTEPGDHLAHAEDEFLCVLAGRVEVDLGDHGQHELGVGDSIYYEGGTSHRWRSLDGGAYRLFVVKETPPVGR